MAAIVRWGSGTAASSAPTSAGPTRCPTSRRGRRREPGAAMTGAAGRRRNARTSLEIDRRRGVIEQLLRAVHADALPHPGQRLQDAREPLRHRGGRTRHAPQGQHRLVQLLDGVDQVLPLLGQPLHLQPDRFVGRLQALELPALLQHGPGPIGIELVAVLVEGPALDHHRREDRRDAHHQHHADDDRRERRPHHNAPATGLEPVQPPQDREGDRRRRQRQQGRRQRQDEHRVA